MADRTDAHAAAAASLQAEATVAAMHRLTAQWHEHLTPVDAADHPLALHRANFELWHLEDRARDPAATAPEIVAIKREIDRINQVRNDHAEAVDVDLLAALQTVGLPRPEAALHSETPGQMLDRLSILSLKRFHTAEETRRAAAGITHQQWNTDRLALLEEQSQDLTDCLQELWAALLRGERRFKRYRQLKMYNDPKLNPVLYAVADGR